MDSLIDAVLHGVQVGGDEGFEFGKTSALAAGEVSGAFWNDQPWLWTQLMALLFRIFGSSIWLPRLATIASCVALLLFMVRIQRLGRSPLGVVMLIVTYLTCRRAFEVNIAYMLEVPMCAFAVASSWLLLKAARKNSVGLSFTSGAVMGLAMNVKLLAVLFAPAAVIAFFMQAIEREKALSGPATTPKRRFTVLGRQETQRVVSLLAVWGAALVAAFAFGLRLSPHWSWSTLVWNHVRAAESAQIKPHLFFSPGALLGQPEALAGGVLGLILLTCRGEYAALAYPCSLFLTMLVAHLAIKPYWYYYEALSKPGLVGDFRGFV